MDELLVIFIKWIVNSIAKAQDRSAGSTPESRRAAAEMAARVAAWEQQRLATKMTGKGRGRKALFAAPIPPPIPAPADTSRVHRLLEDTPEIVPVRSDRKASGAPAAELLSKPEEVTAALILGEILEPPVAIRAGRF